MPSRTRVVIGVPEELGHHAPYHLVRRLRAASACSARWSPGVGRARVALPGGDTIGSRGLDMHIRGLEDLGARVEIEHGQVVAESPEAGGATLWLDFPSVGATENLVMAAVLAEGTTVIDNVAREPEIVDLCQMLVAMGARIDGHLHLTLAIEGVERMHPVEHRTVTDRIVAGTWVFAAAIAGGDLHSRAASRTTSTSCSTSWSPRARRSTPTETGFTRARGPPAGVLRRGDAALPGFPDRPAAVRDGAGRGQRRAPR